MTNIDWQNPYKEKGKFWVKGNLHTHTNISACGVIPPVEVLKIYEKMGYTFLAITDHGVISDPGIYKTKLILLSGIEGDINGSYHFCIINLNKDKIYYNTNSSHQELISKNTGGNGGLVILNHPDWEIREHYTIEELYNLKNYSGIEIYNSVIERLEGFALSTAKWDRLLANDIKVLGFVNQDSHGEYDYKDCCNVVNVNTKEETAENIFLSLRTGNFYCYYGVEILDIGRNSNIVYVKTKNAKLIRFVGFGGRVLKKADSKEAEMKFLDDPKYKYIRMECIGTGEEVSWTQPFFKDAI